MAGIALPYRIFSIKRSLFAKIGLIFFSLLVALTFSLFGVFAIHWDTATNSARQLVFHDLASILARKLEPYTSPVIDYRNLRRAAQELAEMHPDKDMYLLDAQGKVLLDFGPYGELRAAQVDTAPIRGFLSRTDGYPNTLAGTNPRFRDQRTVFSVAEILVNGEPGYLYLTLAGASERISRLMLLERAGLTGLAQGTAVSGMLILLLGLGLFYLVTKRLFRVTAVVREFQRGDFTSRAAVVSNDEIDLLAVTVNAMADTIVTNMGELERRDALRRELVANVAHDLRGPLAVMRTTVELLSAAPVIEVPSGQNDTVKKYSHMLSRSLDSLGTLLDELFELAKLEAKEVSPELRPFFLTGLVDDLLDQHDQAARQSGVNLTSERSHRAIAVLGDIALIERVLRNLLQNAIRHTNQGGEVIVRLTKQGTKANIEVLDTGPGIAEADIANIFTPFFQSKDSGRVGAAGLGLAIVRRILELHHSEIRVANRPEGGARFSFELSLPEE